MATWTDGQTRQLAKLLEIHCKLALKVHFQLRKYRKTAVCRETSGGRAFAGSWLCTTDSCIDGQRGRTGCAAKFVRKIFGRLTNTTVQFRDSSFSMKIQTFWIATQYRLVGGYKLATVYQVC